MAWSAAAAALRLAAEGGARAPREAEAVLSVEGRPGGGVVVEVATGAKLDAASAKAESAGLGCETAPPVAAAGAAAALAALGGGQASARAPTVDACRRQAREPRCCVSNTMPPARQKQYVCRSG